MRKGLVAAVALVAACAIVGSAHANNLAQLYWSKTSASQIVGVRATVDTPDSSQISITNPDFFGTDVEANNGNANPSNFAGMQQGVWDTDGVQIDPNGDCQNHTSLMFYFVERDYHNVYTCYYEGTAQTADSHLQTVKRDPSDDWWGYLDGVQQTYITVDWTDCSSYACGIQANGEEGGKSNGDPQPGNWQAKFSGSGNTPWQFENSCCWNTISLNHYNEFYNPNLWTLNTNSFPNGLWTFIYSH